MNENMGVVEQVTVEVIRDSNSSVAYLIVALAVLGLVYLAYLLIKRGRN